MVKSEFVINSNDFNNAEIVIINPDAIISVGYRDQLPDNNFCRWATSVLREYIVKGFALDDELLKKGTRFGKDYFDHLLSRIRENVHPREYSTKKSLICMQQVQTTIWMPMKQKTSLPQREHATLCHNRPDYR